MNPKREGWVADNSRDPQLAPYVGMRYFIAYQKLSLKAVNIRVTN